MPGPYEVREQFAFATDVIGPTNIGDTILDAGIGSPDLIDTSTFTTIGPGEPWRAFGTQPGGGLAYSLQIQHLSTGCELAFVGGFPGSGRKVFVVYPLATGDGGGQVQGVLDQSAGPRPAGTTYTGVVWRCSDPLNFWYAFLARGSGTHTINVFMHKVVAGVDSFVQAGSYTVPSSTVGLLALPINIVLSGPTMELRDGTGALILTETDAFNQTAKYIGGAWNVEEVFPHDGFSLFDNIKPVNGPAARGFAWGAIVG